MYWPQCWWWLRTNYYLQRLDDEARDGYKVVLSWKELFNSPVGDQVWLVMYVKELETIKFFRVK